MLVLFGVIFIITLFYNFYKKDKKNIFINLGLLLICFVITFIFNYNIFFVRDNADNVKIHYLVFKIISDLELIIMALMLVKNLKNKKKNCVWANIVFFIIWFFSKVVTDQTVGSSSINFERQLKFNRELYFEILMILFVQTNLLWCVLTYKNKNNKKVAKTRIEKYGENVEKNDKI